MRIDYFRIRENCAKVIEAEYFKVVPTAFGGYIVRAYYPGSATPFINLKTFKREASANNFKTLCEQLKKGEIAQ